MIIDLSKSNKFKKDKNSYNVSIGQFGTIINILKQNKCKKVLFAGKVVKPNFSKIKLETIEILYAGILSGGAAFALQLFGQKNIPAAPAAIVMSLEGVVAAIAAWVILSHLLELHTIIGLFLIHI